MHTTEKSTLQILRSGTLRSQSLQLLIQSNICSGHAQKLITHVYICTEHSAHQTHGQTLLSNCHTHMHSHALQFHTYVVYSRQFTSMHRVCPNAATPIRWECKSHCRYHLGQGLCSSAEARNTLPELIIYSSHVGHRASSRLLMCLSTAVSATHYHLNGQTCQRGQ